MPHDPTWKQRKARDIAAKNKKIEAGIRKETVRSIVQTKASYPERSVVSWEVQQFRLAPGKKTVPKLVATLECGHKAIFGTAASRQLKTVNCRSCSFPKPSPPPGQESGES